MTPRVYKHLQQAFIRQGHLTETGVTIILSQTEDRFFSYRDLYREASRMLGSLQQAGLQKGDELIIQTNQNDTFLVLFWAAVLGGMVPVPLHFASGDELKLKLSNVIAVLDQPYVIIDEDQKYGIRQYLLEGAGEPAIEARRVLLLDELPQAVEAGTVVGIEASDVAFIQFSSGSTGNPKGILLTHENLCSNVYDMLDGSAAQPGDVSMSWMPFTHDMGLIGMHLVPLFLGIQNYNIPAPVFVRHPLLWIHKMHEYRVTTTQSPNFGYSFVLSALKKDVAYDWDLSCVKMILNGAEPISAAICRQFLDTFEQYGLKQTTMFTVYGLAEATLAVCFPQPATRFTTRVFQRSTLQLGQPVHLAAKDDNDPIELVSVGRPLQHVQVRICNAYDDVLPESSVGHIQVKGPSVSPGYYGDSTFSHISADGWLRTGDLGCFFGGELIVTGRSKELIIVNGQNFYPYDLEAKLCDILGIAYGKIAVCSTRTAHTERVLVFIQFRKSESEFVSISEQALDSIVALTGGADCVALPLSRLPKTTSGKIQRHKLSEMYASGHFQAAEQAVKASSPDRAAVQFDAREPEALKEQILAYLSAELAGVVPGYSSEDVYRPLMELGINSKQLILLAGKLSRRMGVELQANIFFAYPTALQLALHLTRLLLGNSTEPPPHDALQERIMNMTDDEIVAILEAGDAA